MKPTRLRLPREETSDLADDLTVWAVSSGVDPGLTVVSETGGTSDDNSPVLYAAYVSESLFEQFPECRMFIEQ
jgi:hypothetical protein